MDSKVTAHLVLTRCENNDPIYQQIINLSKNVTIGRDSACNIVWEGNFKISRKHVRLEEHLDLDPNYWTITDESRNRVSVNGTRLLKGVALRLYEDDLIAFLPNEELVYQFKSGTPEGSSDESRILDNLESTKGKGAVSTVEEPRAKKSRLDKIVKSIGKNSLSIQAVPSGDEASFPEAPTSSERKRKVPGGNSNSGGIAITPPTETASMTTAEIDACIDVEVLKEQLKSTRAKLAIAEGKMQNAGLEAAVVKANTAKEIQVALESEIKCVVCDEVYIKPALLDCGHTFCDFCIEEWSKIKKQCPICRKPFNQPRRHIEFENFISKMYDSFKSGEISTRRNDRIKEREDEVLQKKVDAAARAIAQSNPDDNRSSRFVFTVYRHSGQNQRGQTQGQSTYYIGPRSAAPYFRGAEGFFRFSDQDNLSSAAAVSESTNPDPASTNPTVHGHVVASGNVEDDMSVEVEVIGVSGSDSDNDD